MRIALQIALAIVALVVVLLAIEAGLRGARDAAVYEEDLRRDQRILGRALERVAELTWRTHGLDEARALIAAAATLEPGVDAQVLGDLGGAPPGDAPVQVGEPGALRTLLRIDGPEGERRGLVITTSLAGEEAHLARGLREFGLVALALAAFSAGIALWLGRLLVGRRIDRLIERTRRVARGDFSRQEDRERDEIGQLSRALDDMAGELDRARAALEAEVRARAAVTEHLRRSERLATIGTLSAGLAHELGTPLHVIAGRARMIAEDAGGEAAAGARVIAEQAQRMRRIIEQLLDFARIRRPERREVELVALLAGDIEMLAALLERRRVRVRLGRPGGGGEARVLADPDQLRQVFANILINAAHAMPDGGEVEVRVETGLPAPVELADRRRYARVTIVDRGEGIAPEDLPRIFDPFFTTKGVGEGTGLGLAVAHGIIAEHGGLIAAESERGAGSSFHVWLPEAGR